MLLDVLERIALALLATLGVATSTWTACLYMIVLGLGLGLVMQVLVLAVQNAVDYRHLGVATSDTTLFRSIGGSVTPMSYSSGLGRMRSRWFTPSAVASS